MNTIATSDLRLTFVSASAALALCTLSAPAYAGPSYTVVPGQRVEQTLNVPCALQFDIKNKVPTSLDEEHLAWAVTEGKDWTGGNAQLGTFTAAYRDYKLKVYAATGFAGEKPINGGWNPALVYNVRAEVTATSTRYVVKQNGAIVADVSISATAPSRVTMGYGWPPNVRKGATNAVLTNIVWEQGPPAPPVAPPNENQFEAEADTYADPNSPTTVFGATPDLRTGGDGLTTFLRFKVAGVGSVATARVILKGLNAGGAGQIHFLGDNSWSEAMLNWNNRPTPAATPLDSPGKVQIGGEYSFDVTNAVAGDGTYSFAIKSTDPDGSGCHSRESSDQGPILEVVPGPHVFPPDAGQAPAAPDAAAPTPTPDAGAGAGADAGANSPPGTWEEVPITPGSGPGVDPGPMTDSEDSAASGCTVSHFPARSPLGPLALLTLFGCAVIRAALRSPSPSRS